MATNILNEMQKTHTLITVALKNCAGMDRARLFIDGVVDTDANQSRQLLPLGIMSGLQAS